MSMTTMRKLATGLAGLLLSGAASAEMALNMPQGVTAISHEVWKLHMGIFYVCCVIGVLVFGAMFYSVFAHRKSKGHKAAQFHHSTTAEIIWTIIPFVILIAMAIPAAGTLIKMEDTRNADMTIKVTGYQWKWQYTYVDDGIEFFSTLAADSNRARQTQYNYNPLTWKSPDVDNYLLSVDNPLVLPVGKKIRILMTANDVIHAWWVPALAIKKDAIPGYINEVWTRIDVPGVYRGQCAELCGRDHGFMPVVVKAVTQDEYKAWVDAQKSGGVVSTSTQEGALDVASTAAPASKAAPAPAVSAPAAPATASTATTKAPTPAAAAPAAAKPLTKADLLHEGKEAYETTCAACHHADGAGMPPTFPALKGSKVANGPVNAHILQVLKGKNAMPPFAAQLSDEQIAAIVTYERNSFGNSTGDVVQPSQVKALR